MQIKASVFQRNLKTLVWVAFALLALLPILTLIKLGILLLQSPPGAELDVQLLSLGFFIFISLCGGLYILLKVARNLQELSEKSLSMARASPVSQEIGDPNSNSPWKTPVQNELASLTHVLTRMQTEFTQNLDKLRQQAQFLENLQCVLNHSCDMVIIMDDANRVIFSNQSAREKLGLLPDCTLRRSLAEGLLSAPDTARMIAILESWDGKDEELQFTRGDGDCLMVHCLQTVVRLPDQPPSKIVILRDRTESSRMRHQLYRSEHLVSLGQLISGIAHDLNNPLAAILGFAELCRDTSLSREDLFRNLEIIEREANRTARIVENLLNFSRRRTPKKSLIDIHELLDRCLALLSYYFRTGNITVHRNYSTDLPSLKIDEYQIQQVLMNLLVNAAQALKGGHVLGPAITVMTHLLPDNLSMQIRISDNGSGIPAEIIPRIFDPFFSTRKEDQNTGLGLTVAQDIILQHHGELAVESKCQECTTFTVTLPLSPVTAETARDTALEHQSNPLRVLIVEEDPAIMKMIRQALVSLGHSIKTAPNLTIARPLMEKPLFDVLVLDISGADGEPFRQWEERIAQQLDLHIRTVLITDGADTAEILLEKFGGKVECLIKPFQVNSLYAAVLRQNHLIQNGG